MEKVTIQDVRNAIIKIAKAQQTYNMLDNMNNDELFKTDINKLHMFSGKIENLIKQLSEDKHIVLPHELHKVLPDAIVRTIVDTVNLCIQEEEKLGIITEKQSLYGNMVLCDTA